MLACVVAGQASTLHTQVTTGISRWAGLSSRSLHGFSLKSISKAGKAAAKGTKGAANTVASGAKHAGGAIVKGAKIQLTQ